MREGHLHNCLYNETSLFQLMEFKIDKSTVWEINCAAQRLLRWEGEVDLKKRHGHYN